MIRRLIDKTNGLIKTGCLFLSRRTDQQLTPRAIGFIIEKYANQAGEENIGPQLRSDERETVKAGQGGKRMSH